MSEVTKASPERLRSLGVTQRESDILFWLSEGKTNQEIGVLCDISPRTVQKHLENIFPKLGVETRTAAAGVVFDLFEK
ncbi:MAG TPA: helix-turn-helix transcriptional regulator [Pyrinomonadaceae bacterium]